MVDKQTEKNLTEILAILHKHPGGLSISDIATLLPMNRNSVSKYLAILQRQGSVDMRQVGAAKVYSPTRRLPVAAVRRFCSPNLIVVDHNLKVLEVSDTLAAILGATPETLIGHPVSDLFSDISSSDDVTSLLRRALWGEEGTFRWSPGSCRGAASFRFTLIPAVLETGRPAVSLIMEEVPEDGDPGEEHLLKALREVALREDQTEGLVRVSPDGRIRWADDPCCRVIGKDRGDLVGRQFRPPLLDEERTAWKEFVRSLTPDNRSATIDCRMIMPDGSTRCYRWRGRALCSPAGEILEYQYICSDIHEFWVLERSLRRQQQVLEQEADACATALRESEERFRLVFEKSPVGIAFCAMDGTILRANHALLAMLGIRDREEIGEKNAFTDLQIPEKVLPSLQDRKTARFIVSYSRKEHQDRIGGSMSDLKTICLEGVASPMHSKEGDAPSGFVLQFCDVTWQKEARVAREVESRYWHLLETLVEGVIYLGADGRIIDANPAAEHILGYSLSDMRGRTCSELRWRFIDESSPGHLKGKGLLPHLTTLATGIPERKTLGIFNPREGSYRWIDTHTVPRFRPGEESPFQVIVIFSDITRQREVEEAWLESEKQSWILTESLPDVTFLLDPGGHLLYVNAFGAQMLHRPLEEILGKNLQELFQDGQGARYLQNVASAAASGTIKNNVSRLQLPDGEAWYDTRLIPVSAQDGTCQYVMGVARDITVWKQAEEVSQRCADRFRSVFEELPIGSAVCDAGGVLLHMNQACLDLFGIACPDTVRGVNLLQVCRSIGGCDMQRPKDAVTPFGCLLDFDLIRSRGLLPTTLTGTIRIEGLISPLRSLDGYLFLVYDSNNRVPRGHSNELSLRA